MIEPQEVKVRGVSERGWQIIISALIIAVIFALLYIGLNLQNVVELLSIREIREAG